MAVKDTQNTENKREDDQPRSGLTRRDFGRAIGLAGAAHVVSAADALAMPALPAQDRPVQDKPTAPPAGQAAVPDVYTFFTPAEAAFVEAAVARLIPADDLGPGAREAGVPVFIDRQLSGTYGTGGKWYTQGPWGESTREQGYQLPLMPRDLYRLCIEQIDTRVRKDKNAPFIRLSAADQDAVLASIQKGELTIPGVPVAEFFNMLLGNTIEGFFADPVYGGNRNKAGWRLVGFPGVAASYVNVITRYNEPYRVEPVSIADVLERRVAVDENGHVVHKELAELSSPGAGPQSRQGGR
jgi:gluconate 2-dehydrogenase gamma chain